MPDISQITLPSGSIYNIKDSTARQDIEDLRNSITGGVHYLGATTTALSDGAATNPITISGNSHTCANGDLVNYGDKEFVWDGSKWNEMGDLGAFKALAYKDNASGNFTPSGSVGTPTITVTPSTTTINPIDSVGSLPAFSATVSNENLTFSWNAGALPTKGSDVTVATGIQSAISTQPSFTGTQGTVTVS